MDGSVLGSIFIQDLKRLLGDPKKGNRWLGCIEWNINGAGEVSVKASCGSDNRMLNNGRAPPGTIGAIEGFRADDPAFMMYVRLEPGVYHSETIGIVNRVLNINNVAMDERLQGKGTFKALLKALETWMRDDEDANRPRALMVQNISNNRLYLSLGRRPGWSAAMNEWHTVMCMGSSLG
jgi:GNAT superfamily N-acetyltransferase